MYHRINKHQLESRLRTSMYGFFATTDLSGQIQIRQVQNPCQIYFVPLIMFDNVAGMQHTSSSNFGYCLCLAKFICQRVNRSIKLCQQRLLPIQKEDSIKLFLFKILKDDMGCSASQSQFNFNSCCIPFIAGFF